MVTTKKTKLFYYCLFLLPAITLYLLFFIVPFFQGIQYSLTDWNGIVPEIPFTFSKADFDTKVAAKLHNQQDLHYLRRFYQLNDSGETYNLVSWVKEAGKTRQIDRTERSNIKNILKSVGVTPVKYVGLDNYKQMFQNDQRFVPRVERRYLFNEFDDLPAAIKAKAFHKDFISHVSNPHQKSFVLAKYRYDRASDTYRLTRNISDSETERLQQILSKNMFSAILIPGVIGFTLFFTFFNVIFSNFFALLLALILDTKMRTRNLLRSVFFFPNVLSLIIVAFIWSFVFRLLMPLVTGISVWLGSPDLAPYALLMVTIWQGCGWLMVIYLAGLQTIPVDIVEGAQIDGAAWWQRLGHITLPLLIPAFTICIFFSLANSLKTFDIIMALTQGGPGYVTTPIVLDIYYNAFRDNLFGYATAKAVFLCLVIIAITSIQLSIMKKREVEL